MTIKGKEVTPEGIEVTVCRTVYRVSRQGLSGRFKVTSTHRSGIKGSEVFKNEKTLVEFFRKIGIKC